MRLFSTPEGDAGFALKGDDIVSVFKHPSAPYRNVTKSMLEIAVGEGGRRLDAFDTVLPHLYGQSGFRTVARLGWNDEYTPDGWNHADFAGYNGGRPDVVFMAHDPQAGAYQPGDGRTVQDYDEGTAHQHAALAHVAARGDVPAAPGPEAYGSGQLIRLSEGQTPITVWHGTPHEFKGTRVNPLGEFNLSKMGTGEGAQVYAKGVYKAEAKKLGERYRSDLSEGVKYRGKTAWMGLSSPDFDAVTAVAEHMKDHLLGPAEAITSAQKAQRTLAQRNLNYVQRNPHFDQATRDDYLGTAKKQLAVANRIGQLNPADFDNESGSLYESELHIDPEHLLHWDKPIGEQSAYIRQRTGDLVPAKMAGRLDNMTGEALHGYLAGASKHDAVMRVADDAQMHRAARRLLDAGIPGIKYLDADSRSLAPYPMSLRSGGMGYGVGDSQGNTRTVREFKTLAEAQAHVAANQTHNYVVFDPRTIHIIKRNGLPAMVAAGADATRDHKKAG